MNVTDILKLFLKVNSCDSLGNYHNNAEDDNGNNDDNADDNDNDDENA